jgi:hypothetical protein
MFGIEVYFAGVIRRAMLWRGSSTLKKKKKKIRIALRQVHYFSPPQTMLNLLNNTVSY